MDTAPETWQPQPGSHGVGSLPPGRRLGIFLILLLAPPALLYLVARQSGAAVPAAVPASSMPFWLPLINDGVLLLWVGFVTWMMARLEQRPFGAYGLPLRHAFGRRFWQGVVWGAVALTVLLLLIFACGDFRFGSLTASGGALLLPALAWAAALVVVALFEEFTFRGYVLTTLRWGVGFWPAAIILSVLFGAVHLGNSGESYVGALSAGFLGLFFCFTWQRTGDLWFAVGLHAAWDFFQSIVYGVPDSGAVSAGRMLSPHFQGSRWITGGSVGPEGSVWVLLVVALLFVAFARRFPERSRSQPSRASNSSSTP